MLPGHGDGGMSEEYVAAVRSTDARLGRVLSHSVRAGDLADVARGLGLDRVSGSRFGTGDSLVVHR